MPPPTNWTSADGEYLNHGVGRFGEQTFHDWAGKNGYVILYGASGSTRSPRGSPYRVHQPTTKGLDVIAYRPSDGQVLVVDNKAGGDTGAVTEVGAFTNNLREKLRNRIDKLERAKGGLPAPMQQHVNKAVADLRRTEQALGRGGKGWPANVKFAVANAGGAASGVSKPLLGQLRAAGIKNVEFIDFRNPQVRRVTLAGGAGKPSRSALKGSLTRLPSLAKLGLSGLGFAGTTFGLIGMATASPAANTAAQVLNPKGLIKEAMLDGLRNMPQPKADPRSAATYFSDPATAGGIRVIDLLSKNLRPFGDELAAHHQQVRAVAAMEIFGLAAMAQDRPDVDRVEYLADIRDQLDVYADELRIVADNLVAAKELSGPVMNAARGAERLAGTMSNGYVMDQMFKSGWYTVDELMTMVNNLQGFASVAQGTFRDIDALNVQVERQRQEIWDLSWELSKLSWGIILAPLINGKPAAPDYTPDPARDREAVLSVLPSDFDDAIPLDEIKRRVRSSGSDFIPSVEKVLTDLENRFEVSSASGPGVRHGKVWYRPTGPVHRPTAD